MGAVEVVEEAAVEVDGATRAVEEAEVQAAVVQDQEVLLGRLKTKYLAVEALLLPLQEQNLKALGKSREAPLRRPLSLALEPMEPTKLANLRLNTVAGTGVDNMVSE